MQASIDVISLSPVDLMGWMDCTSWHEHLHVLRFGHSVKAFNAQK